MLHCWCMEESQGGPEGRNIRGQEARILRRPTPEVRLNGGIELGPQAVAIMKKLDQPETK